MWRLCNSLTRGARTVRPSQCCTQDTTDETGSNSYQCGPPPSSIQCLSIARHYTSCPDAIERVKKDTWQIVGISKCLYNKVLKWGSSQVKYSDGRPKLSWVWEIPYDIYPHTQGDSKDKRSRSAKWERLHRRRQQLILTNSILNVLGWGSAAALTLTLCQYLRTYPLGRMQIVLPINAVHSNVENPSICDHNHLTFGTNVGEKDFRKHEDTRGETAGEEYCKQNSYNALLSQKWWLSNNIHFQGHHCWVQDPQNENQKTSIGQHILNPKIRELLVASLLTPSAELPPAEKDERVDERNKESQYSLLANVQEISDFYVDAKPQIETDQEELERNRLKRAEDSGYVGSEGHDRNYSSVIQQEFIVCNHAAEDKLVDLSSTQSQKFETDEGLNEGCSKSELAEPDTCILLNETCQFHQEELLVEAEKSESKLHLKEEVLIEDCSCDDSFQNITSPAQADEFKTQTSPPKQNDGTVGIDEFSDGLKEIIEAGEKDLNDFSTQFLGILEGDIGRSLASEEPDVAINYIHAGALLGDAASSFNLALCYHMAHGVEQDLKKARELYEAASLVGHGWATYNLAVMLSEGQGGPSDPRRAHTLLVEAAKKGVKEAQMALEQMKSLQEDTNSFREKASPATSESGRRHSFGSVQSEPLLPSLLSQMWLSSYSMTDLDFLEDSMDHRIEDLSSVRIEATEKARFYLE